LLAICPVDVRSNTEHLPDKYWTSTEHEWELLPCSILVTLGLLTGYIGDVPLIYVREFYSEIKINITKGHKDDE
jgi:hypothetical protein